MEELSLIDVSGEDDFLFDLASSPQHPDPPPRAAPGALVAAADLEQPAGGSEAAAAGKGKALDPSGATEQGPERTESPKKWKAKGGVNLRKSLAWDSAFFTGEGVLDTEELGIVNSTFRKAQGSRLLPGIAEEMRRSSESTTSTLESESFVLESLETELFDNVRASIQRTLGKPDKAPGVAAASSRTPKAVAKAPPVTARKGVDRIPQIQSKIRPPASTTNGGVSSKQRPQVTPKEPAAARVAVSRAAEAKPSSKPPRALPRVATVRAPTNTATTSVISDKRSSTGGAVNRQTVGKSASTSASMPSRPVGGTKTNSTKKSGALSSAAIPSSHRAPMGTMPGAKTKSPTLIGKTRTAQRIPIRSSSRSDISKVEPARASRNKIPTRGHIEGASPIISPSSSVDSMSSVISGVSTASTIGKASHTSESFSTSSSSLSPSIRKSNDNPQLRPPTVTEGTPRDNLKSIIDTSTQGNGFKPSGLRRPTPKIGYFDAEKSVEQKAARVQMQSSKVLFSPLATPNPRISSTPKANFEFSTSDQQELKSMAAAVSQTKASLPFRVAQNEVRPSKVSEHEASQIKASTSLPLRVAETEVDSIMVTEHEASHTEASPSLPLRVAEIEVKPSKVMEHEASQTKASTSLPLTVAETEIEPSKVSEHEADRLQIGPLVAVDIAEESILALHQNMQANGDGSPSTVKLSSCTDDQQESETTAALGKESSLCQTNIAQTEVEQSKVSQHEADMLETGPLVAVGITEGIPALHQNIQANGDGSPSTVKLSSCTDDQQEPETTEALGKESSPSQTNVAQTEVEPAKVSEHEANMLETGPLVAVDIAEENIPALHQNIQSNGDGSPSTVKLLSSTIDQQESETTAAAGEESSPSQTNVAQTEVDPSKVTEYEASQMKESPSLPLAVAKMEVEPSEVIDNEACMPQACPPSLPLGVAEMEIEPSEVIDNEACMPQACTTPSLSIGVAEMEIEPSEVIDREACMAHACFAALDTANAKENIPSLHQNIQPSGALSPLKRNILASHENIQSEVAMTPVKGTILASHPNVQAIGDMTPVTLLTQKLSSISLGAANGDATPLTLLAQKLSSISLGDATD